MDKNNHVFVLFFKYWYLFLFFIFLLIRLGWKPEPVPPLPEDSSICMGYLTPGGHIALWGQLVRRHFGWWLIEQRGRHRLTFPSGHGAPWWLSCSIYRVVNLTEERVTQPVGVWSERRKQGAWNVATCICKWSLFNGAVQREEVLAADSTAIWLGF